MSVEVPDFTPRWDDDDFHHDPAPQPEWEIRDGDLPEPYFNALSWLHYRFYDILDTFPYDYSLGANRGSHQIVDDLSAVVRSHLAAGNETHVELPLHGGRRTLPLDLSGNEPLELLQTLGSASRMARYIMNFSTEIVPVTKSKDYHLYRVRDQESREIQLYVRPYGSATYNEAMEYGRPGQGVEASMGVIVDLAQTPKRLPEVGRHRRPGPDTRISIRVDREGVRPADRGNPNVQHDPTQQEGTPSLDIGSVLGCDDWIGTKIGRLLAYGDLLRAQREGRPTSLNHVTRGFERWCGDANFFALRAHEMIDKIEDKRHRLLGGLVLA